MAYKDLLVHMDNGRSIKSRLNIAVKLAADNDAHLTGLYVMTRPHVPQFIQAHIGEEVLEAQRSAIIAGSKKAEELFIRTCEREGVKYEWRSIEDDLFEGIRLHTRYADLAILGQYDPDNSIGEGADSLIDRLVLSAGRPVLVIPYVGEYPTMGSRAMVAWDGGRLAARAINDAIPLIQNSKLVEVLAINPKAGNGQHGDIPGADICLHLARHGIRADAEHIISPDVDPGNLLLSRAADQSIDLIIMGAYGHRRLRELVLGGMTHHILKHMTVPVLMDH
ncbi:MAG: universal stress protein [Alphaproteobacteria bacterium]|nr:universal stress protein [Rhodospirillales bacterium]MCW9044851.1 universal stress protein [Alphaproteobacteria bacterium]